MSPLHVIITVLLADILGALVSPQGGAAEAPPERAHHVHLQLFLMDHKFKWKKIHFIYSSNPLGSLTLHHSKGMRNNRTAAALMTFTAVVLPSSQ